MIAAKTSIETDRLIMLIDENLGKLSDAEEAGLRRYQERNVDQFMEQHDHLTYLQTRSDS